MQIQYATSTEGKRIAWPLKADDTATRGLIIGGMATGKSETLRTLAAHAKAKGIQVWACSHEASELASKNMTRPEWEEAIRSYTGKDPVLALLDTDERHDLESIPKNPRVSVAVTGNYHRDEAYVRIGESGAPRLKGEDARLDLGTRSCYGGSGRGLMRTADSTGQTSHEVAVDYMPRTPIARR